VNPANLDRQITEGRRIPKRKVIVHCSADPEHTWTATLTREYGRSYLDLPECPVCGSGAGETEDDDG
jgi:hypothetical protein